MKVGSLVFATDQGLGILAKDFYDNGVVTDVVIIHHSSRTTHRNWYPDHSMVKMNHAGDSLREFVREMDVMLFFETPFDWSLIQFCKEHNVLSVLMPMHECMPEHLPQIPDRFLCPSLLDLDCYPTNSVYIPIPVDVKWRSRERAIKFVHNAGNLGLLGRNGTRELFQSLSHVKNPIELLVRAQDPKIRDLASQTGIDQDPRVELVVETVPKDHLFSEGDVFIFPEKFNGLSLPLQEAHASGMLVMSTNRFPMNKWLPSECLIKPKGSQINRVNPRCRPFLEAIVCPYDIASTIDCWYGKEIKNFSLAGKVYAEENSWNTLLPQYIEAISP